MTIYESLMAKAAELRQMAPQGNIPEKGIDSVDSYIFAFLKGHIVTLELAAEQLEALAKQVCAEANVKLDSKLKQLTTVGGFVDIGDIIGGPHS